MPEPLQAQIFAELERILEGIQKGTTPPGALEPYRMRVRKVERVLRHWSDVPDSERPWIGYMPERATYQYLPGRTIRVSLPFRLLAYVRADDIDNRDRDVERMLADLVQALNHDQTLGGCVVSVTITGPDTDEGDIEGDGIVEVPFTVVYYRPSNGTT